jgi:hypothetical protein
MQYIFDANKKKSSEKKDVQNESIKKVHRMIIEEG